MEESQAASLLRFDGSLLEKFDNISSFRSSLRGASSGTNFSLLKIAKKMTLIFNKLKFVPEDAPRRGERKLEILSDFPRKLSLNLTRTFIII